jgi:putative peptide zinc metalloprotease protein
LRSSIPDCEPTSRRLYRGQVWYVLRDGSSGRHHRVSEQAYHIVGRLNGQASIQEIWESVVHRLGEGAPTQDEVIHVLSTLHENHLIQSEMAPNVDELFQRRDAREKQKRAACRCLIRACC